MLEREEGGRGVNELILEDAEGADVRGYFCDAQRVRALIAQRDEVFLVPAYSSFKETIVVTSDGRPSKERGSGLPSSRLVSSMKSMNTGSSESFKASGPLHE